MENSEKPHVQRKRLFWDIETSLNIGAFWRSSYKTSISYEQIINEREVICICYKWEGDDEVHSLDWDKGEYRMLEKFLEVINEADETVAHNGDRFDLPWIRGRCLFHRLPMFPEYQTIDTLKLVKGKGGFNFQSNKLDYIGNFLGVGEKQDTNFKMWMDLTIDRFMHPVDMADEQLKKMVEYCKEDVRLLERVYNAIKNYTKVTYNYAVASNIADPENKWRCPECGSGNVNCNKTRTTKMGTVRRGMHCFNCKKYYVISNKAYKDMITWKAENKFV